MDILESIPLEFQHQVCELYEEGYSFGRVSRMVGPVPRHTGRQLPLSECAIKHILEHYDVPIRKAGYVGRGNKAKTSLKDFQAI